MSINDLLSRGISEVIGEGNLEKKLQSGEKLRIKFGIDPTGPDIHLGHTVPIRKLKAFQEMGHTAVFIVGDFTARIGDPSGLDKTRQALSEEEVKANADGYFKQAFKILDENKTEIHMQSEWYKDFDPNKFLELLSKVSVAQVLEHETFKKRVENKLPFTALEMIYPILQGYDSVAVKADVELGGTDQKFNLLMGRQVQKAYGLPEQDIVTLKYLIGTDGKEKMSKSLGNYIAINDSPADMYGKVMSIPDELIVPYYELVTDITSEGLDVVKKELNPPAGGGKNPRDVKARLAYLIVEEYHSAEKAEEAQAEFDKVFKNKELPSNIKTAKKPREMRLDDLLVFLEMADSKSEARRLVEQGAVDIDGEKQTDPYKMITSDIYLADGTIIKAGPQNIIRIK